MEVASAPVAPTTLPFGSADAQGRVTPPVTDDVSQAAAQGPDATAPAAMPTAVQPSVSDAAPDGSAPQSMPNSPNGGPDKSSSQSQAKIAQVPAKTARPPKAASDSDDDQDDSAEPLLGGLKSTPAGDLPLRECRLVHSALHPAKTMSRDEAQPEEQGSLRAPRR